MKTPRIANAVGFIDDELVLAAAEYKRPSKTKRFIKWAAIAASFAAVIVAVLLILPLFNDKNGFFGGQINPTYGQNSAVEWPWKYKTAPEKYSLIKYNTFDYIPSGEISEDKLGESLGICTGMGTDSYTDKIHTEIFKAREIKGISKLRLIAVEMEGKFYVCKNQNVKKPSTFGGLLDVYNLNEVLPLSRFTVCEGYKEKNYYKIADDDYIWQVLSECRDAKAYGNPDSWDRGERNYLSFTATSEELGAYKKVFYITEDGYVSTNVFEYAYVYFIGEEAAGKIIDYATKNAVRAEREPYEYTLFGTLTEIGDGYLLIDTSLFYGLKSKTVKVLTDDIRLRRCYEVGGIKVGDIVAITHRKPIEEGGGTVTDAFNMETVIISDGDVGVPE